MSDEYAMALIKEFQNLRSAVLKLADITAAVGMSQINALDPMHGLLEKQRRGVAVEVIKIDQGDYD